MKKSMIGLFVLVVIVLAVAVTFAVTKINPQTKATDAFLNEPYAFVTTQGTTMTVLFIEKKGKRIEGEMLMYDTLFHRDGSHEVERIRYKMSGNTLHQKPQHFTMYLQNDDKTVQLSGEWSEHDVYVIRHPHAQEANFEPVTEEEYVDAIQEYHQAMDDMIVEWED